MHSVDRSSAVFVREGIMKRGVEGQWKKVFIKKLIQKHAENKCSDYGCNLESVRRELEINSFLLKFPRVNTVNVVGIFVCGFFVPIT